jgi:Peroxisome biogenesis factor 1, N-terminal
MLPDYFNVPKQSQVSVQVLTNVIDAKDLLIEPLSNDDWELVESHALWLEGGGLLQQICIVFPDQIIGLYMEGWRDVAYVKVLRSNFCYKSGMLDTVDVWPGENQFDTNEYPSQHNCLRLVANTKVVVIPKERNLITTNFSPWLRIIPSLEEYKNDVYLQRLSSLLEKPVVAASVPYLALVVHPTTARKMLPNAVSLDANEPPVVRVQISRTIIDSGNNDQYRNCTSTFASLLTSLAVPENSSGK